MAKLVHTALVLAHLAHHATALGTNYEHDSKTTYCWAIPRPTNMTTLTEDDRTTAFSTPVECPIALTLSLSPSDSVHAFERVNVTWTVEADFSGTNAINNTQLYYGPDKSGRLAQIVHSNVHSCVFGTGCDPFNDGKELVDKTVNKIANFTDNVAIFSDSLQFPSPGEYSVLAHIILPNYDETSRFDYAVYAKLTVLAAESPTTAPPTDVPIETTAAPTADTTNSTKSSGLSLGVIVAIIIGAIVVAIAIAVIIFIQCRRREQNANSDGYMPAPTQDSGHAGRPVGLKVSDATYTGDASALGFQSGRQGGEYTQRSVGIDDVPPPSYHDHYALPRPSDARHSSDFDRFSAPMQPQTHVAVQHARKKRIESDVEL